MNIKEITKLCFGTVKRVPLWISMLIPRSKNIYMFGAWYGQRFSDNSRALYLYTLKHTNKKCVWICKNREIYNTLLEKGLPVAMTSSLKGIYYQLRAGVAFSVTGAGDFCRELLGNCVHVELWHGVGGGKKIGMDDRAFRENALVPRRRFYAKLEKIPMRKRYFVATCREMQKVFESAFGIDQDHFIHGGQTRNDMFYDSNYVMNTISKEEFAGKRIVVYMPTHRQEGKVLMDMSKLLDLPALDHFCRENNMVFLIKKHFYHANEREYLEDYSNIIDITRRTLDTNELLMVADYLISDYSSCTADYLLLDRPVFYYCFDYEDYLRNDRDMYWDYDTITPGSRSYTFEDLMTQLTKLIVHGQDEYIEERKRVRDMFYAPENQCCASEKVLEQVEQILNQHNR